MLRPVADDFKRSRSGTHRALLPTETISRVRPRLHAVGITRVADVTGLDSLGVPTFQAIRPMSKSLCVSQGKGLTRDLAWISAVMESIELWHAEQPAPQVRGAAMDDVQALLTYDVYGLPRPRYSLLNSGSILDWVPGWDLTTGRETLVPWGIVNMNSEVREEWDPPMWSATSNGLASGNTLDEAILHGLCEVVEREVLSRVQRDGHAPPQLDLGSVTDRDAASLIERISRAGSLMVHDCTAVMGVPCYRAWIWSREFPIRMAGSGCHLDPVVALCRALTEAAQARLTLISGTRDDLQPKVYEFLDAVQSMDRPNTALSAPCSFSNVDLSHPTFGEDIRWLTNHIAAEFRTTALFIDLSNADVNIPVVKVIVPNFKFDPV
jgi:ribosomal protein S12 methylthiotransferase accessory factor